MFFKSIFFITSNQTQSILGALILSLFFLYSFLKHSYPSTNIGKQDPTLIPGLIEFGELNVSCLTGSSHIDCSEFERYQCHPVNEHAVSLEKSYYKCRLGYICVMCD